MWAGLDASGACSRPPASSCSRGNSFARAPVAVLTLHGALSPVHTGHTAMFEAAAAALHDAGYRVLCGLFAPSWALREYNPIHKEGPLIVRAVDCLRLISFTLDPPL